MKKAAIWGGVVLALIIIGRVGLGYMFTSGEENSAKERVRRVFDGLKSGGNRQEAIPLWRHGSFNAGSQQEFESAANELDAWSAKHKIDPVVDYEIKEATVLGEQDRLGNAVVRVAGTVNGRPFSMRVQQGARLEMEGPNTP
jgi:hypothetical protein